MNRSRASIRRPLRRTAVAAVVAIACLVPGTATGADEPVLPHARALIRNGTLVVIAKHRRVHLAIIPKRDGYDVTGTNGTTLGPSGRLHVPGDALLDWKFRFGRAKSYSISVDYHDDDFTRPQVKDVTITGGRDGSILLKHTDIAGSLRADLRRNQTDRSVGLTLNDTTVAGDVSMKSSSYDTGLHLRDGTRVLGDISLRVKARLRSGTRGGWISISASTIRSLDARAFYCNNRVRLQRAVIEQDLRLRGDYDFEAVDSSVLGDLYLDATFDEQVIECDGLVVAGAAVFSTGKKGDTFDIANSSFGILDVRGGSGSDQLHSTGLTVGTGSQFDGAEGEDDLWRTDAPAQLGTIGVERIERAGTEER